MEAAPEFWENPLTLRQFYVRSPSGEAMPPQCSRDVRDW